MTESNESAVRSMRARIERLERELRAGEERMRTLVESLPFDFWMIDAEGRYVRQNQASRSHWGDALGKRAEDVAPTAEVLETWRENNRRVLAGETIRAEVEFDLEGARRTYLNVLAPIVEDGRVTGVVGVNIDITDTKRLESEIQRVQRLESLGVLAGGIAHDFNNLLAAILGNVELARRTLDAEAEAVRYLREAETACDHGRALTRQLLTFAKGGAPVRVPTDLGALLAEAAPFAARGSPCRVHVSVDAPLPPGDVDPGQIRQVVQNLVLNAVQTMPSGGVVHVEVSAASPPAEAASRAGASWVRLRVRDEGPGIPPEVQSRLFEPYFTTKAHGHGLGLSVVHSIVHRHGGYVRVGSNAPHGAIFDVYLPATTARPGTRDASFASKLSPRRVLLLDDDALLRRMVMTILHDEGHDVTSVATVADALDAFRSARASGMPFDVVLLDLTVPGGAGGIACLRELQAIDPEVRAVLSSGYCDDPALASPEGFGARAALEKPFTREQLLSALHRALAT